MSRPGHLPKTGDQRAARPFIALAGFGGGGALLFILVGWMSIFRPFSSRTAPPPPPPTTVERMAATARDVTRPPEGQAPAAPLPQPRWIWSSREAGPGQRAWFRREIPGSADISRATLRIAADNHAIIRIDGAEIGRTDDWMTAAAFDITKQLAREGEAALLQIEAANDDGPGAIIALVEIERAGAGRFRIVTDASWQASDSAESASPRAATEVGQHGIAPWGDIAGLFGDDLDRQIEAPPGFIVELVYAVPRSQGSWVSMTVDDEGRLITSDQTGGLFRITPAPIGSGAAATVALPIDSPVGAAQGLLAVGSDLYAVVAIDRAEGPGLYRLRDSDGDDQYDQWQRLRAFSDGGEHGPHGIVRGPDGMLYIVAGNHTPLPQPEQSAAPRHWDEDLLLPRLWDALGHAVGIMAPGGWICRTDLDGASWEVVAIGMRNCYDIAFNRDGELFTFDADMEWDMGAPWYRPTRILHVVSGADFGWRSGTGKWPAHYPDSLPGVLDVGPGSPTGVCFGDGAKFPQRYREAMFALDWTFGTIYAVHFTERGASYTATIEPFITGRPLPVCDAVVNPADGALYFVIGGRGVPSAIYRVRYAGDETDVPGTSFRVASAARAERRRLEDLHHQGAQADIDLIWNRLAHEDRFIAHAARIALEHQPVNAWAARALAEPDWRKRIAASVALARCGDTAQRQRLIASLRDIPWQDLSRDDRLNLLRAFALTFIRLGRPDPSLSAALADELAALYPSHDDLIDRELCDLLVYLDSPVVVARTIPLMERSDAGAPQFDSSLLARNDSYGSVILKMAAALPQQQQVHYALALRSAKRGWTPQLRERYFAWFDAARRTSGGLSFSGFLENIRQDALRTLPDHERAKYQSIGADAAPALAGLPAALGPGRAWTTDELTALAHDRLRLRDFDNGRRMFAASMCSQCHRFAGEGRAGGPDLTALATRFTMRDLVQSIIEPSHTISDQYEQTEFTLTDGSVVIGRVIKQSEDSIRILQNLLLLEMTLDIPLADIEERRTSAVSAMMPRLLDPLSEDEALDLLAYLLSEGDRRHPMFEQPDGEGFIPLFDGRTLDGWKGDGRFWSVEGGEIVGRSTADVPVESNTFLIWQGSRAIDFELRAEVLLRGDNNNSGIQYRGMVQPGFGVHGYQCDIHSQVEYHGMLYEEGGRGIIATHGERVRLLKDGSREPIEPAHSTRAFPMNAWHEYTIIAQGRRIEHRIDGVTTVIVEDLAHPRRAGVIALQLHAGPAYEVRFRNLRLRRME